MTCISETFCSTGSVFELVYAAASAIDFAGNVFFGHRWEAVAPELAARVETIQGLIADFFAKPLGGCQRYASLGTIHG